MKRLLILLLFAFAFCFCACEKDETTGKLYIEIYDGTQFPLEARIKSEAGNVLYELKITKNETSVTLNPGNYVLEFPRLWTKAFQIRASHKATFRVTNLNSEIIYD